MTRLQELERIVRGMDSVVVAFSGGVDSSVVAAVAARTLGDRALAVTAVSPALAGGELEAARAVARQIGIAHETIATRELEREAYLRNDARRCYHCKIELYEQLEALADRRGLARVVSGANADDLGDWRPGLDAAAEHNVRHPLVEARCDKHAVRELARLLALTSADKPASPCLASRLPYGTRVSSAALERIDAAERSLKLLGYRVLRVRHLGTVAKVQIGEAELSRALSPAGADAIVRAVRAAGYEHVTIDRAPFRSGSLNAGVRDAPPPTQPNASTAAGAGADERSSTCSGAQG